MLRVGLTGGLGSGKSTVLAMLAAHGAHTLSSDAIGRELMQPGEAAYTAILGHFGGGILQPDGQLDRSALARIAFAEGRVEELNAIVHPLVLARQSAQIEQIGRREPNAIVVVESALLFDTTHAGPEGWQSRFDVVVLIRSSDATKIARFIGRSTAAAQPASPADLEAEALRRLAAQLPDAAKAPKSDFILTNDGTLAELQLRVDALWTHLTERCRAENLTP